MVTGCSRAEAAALVTARGRGRRRAGRHQACRSGSPRARASPSSSTTPRSTSPWSRTRPSRCGGPRRRRRDRGRQAGRAGGPPRRRPRARHAGRRAAGPLPGDRRVGDPERPGIVHRLDRGHVRPAGGGPHAAGLREPGRPARRPAVERRYLALVSGHPDPPAGWSTPRSAARPAAHPHGRPSRRQEARTRYEVDELFDDPPAWPWCACRLETGRTHQIRVHLPAIGHPVVGDASYGGGRPGVASPALPPRRRAGLPPPGDGGAGGHHLAPAGGPPLRAGATAERLLARREVCRSVGWEPCHPSE